jgi:hypothetical protein
MSEAAARSSWPAGHVVHMSLDHRDPAQSISVAECDCGWIHRSPWPGPREAEDAAIENHWREVESRTSD